jgi:voltage-gated potassium channel
VRLPLRPTAEPTERLVTALVVLLGITAGGTAGFWTLGAGHWSFVDCLYMTVMTVTTVGYGEVLPGFSTMPYARLFSTGLMIVGVTAVAYSATLVASVILEGELYRALGIRKMTKKLAQLSDHHIVCGAGSTGFHVLHELVARGEAVCVIDASDERIERLQAAFPEVPVIRGDATEDDVLAQAGIQRAKGVFAALSQDKDNLFVVISARQTNPKARIVARAIELKAVQKLRVAGADAVVSPNYLGGRRMASEMMRPEVVAFMDVVLMEHDREFDIEEVRIPVGSAFAGRTLADARVRQVADVNVLAVGDANGAYRYNPPPDTVLPDGGRVMVFGSAEAVDKLRGLLG